MVLVMVRQQEKRTLLLPLLLQEVQVDMERVRGA